MPDKITQNDGRNGRTDGPENERTDGTDERRNGKTSYVDLGICSEGTGLLIASANKALKNNNINQ